VVGVTGLVPLLFALNFATALPPAALMFPAKAPCPVVRPGFAATLSAADLARLLERPTLEIGSGRIELADVDARLGGLALWLDVFQVGEGGGALVGLGVIGPGRAARGHRATTSDLWRAAREALVQQGITWVVLRDVGDDGFLAVYGRTVQVAWLARDHVLTACVSRLDRDVTWTIRAARSIAALADEHIRGRTDPGQPVPA
jgi:hypothetical protein